MQKKQHGHKADITFKKFSMELGCTEAGRFDGGKHATKQLVEGGMKMPKMMEDIFLSLCQQKPESIRNIRAIQRPRDISKGSVTKKMRYL